MSKAERTREFIIETVAPIFNKKGYMGTSLSDLTEATGLTKGSVYGNFKNKQEVALYAFRRNLRLVVDAVRREMTDANSPIEKLLAYPRAYKKSYKAMAATGGCPIVNTAVEADDTNPELLKLALETIDMWKNAIVTLVERGRRMGEIDSNVDADTAAKTIITLIEGASLLSKATGDESFMQNAIDQITAIIESMRTEV